MPNLIMMVKVIFISKPIDQSLWHGYGKIKRENNVEEIETGKMKNRVYVKSKELIKPNNKRR